MRFEDAHEVCVALLKSVDGVDFEGNALKLRRLFADADAADLQQLQAAVVLPLRLLLRSRSLVEQRRLLVVQCLDACLQRTLVDEYSLLDGLLQQLFSLVAQPHNSAQLVGCEQLKLAVVQCVRSALAGLRVAVAEQLFAAANLPPLGQHVFVLVEIVRQEKGAPLKTLALRCLADLCAVAACDAAVEQRAAASMAAVTPGVVICIGGQVSGGATPIDSTTAVAALDLLEALLLLVLRDQHLTHAKGAVGSTDGGDSANHALEIDRSPEWFQTTGANVSKVLKQVYRRLVCHHRAVVRARLIKLSAKLRSSCCETLSAAEGAMVEATVALTADADVSVSLAACALVGEWRADTSRWPPVYARLQESAFELCSRLPTIVRSRSAEQAAGAVGQLRALLACIGPEGFKRMCNSAVHLERLVLSLFQVIDFDHSRIPIVANQSEDDKSTTLPTCASLRRTAAVDGDVLDMPLQYFTDESEVERLCLLIGELGDTDVLVYELLDRFAESSAYEVKAAFVMERVLRGATTGQLDSDLVQSVGRALASRLAAVDVDAAPTDGRVVDQARAVGADSLLVCVLLDCIGGLAENLAERFLPLLQTCLGAVVQTYTSGQWALSDAALRCLRRLAGALRLDGGVSQLLLDNAAYLLNSVNSSLRRYEPRDRSPLSLAAIVHLCDSPAMFEHVTHIVDEILRAIDQFHARRCILFMKVLLSFVRALRRWFPTKLPAPVSAVKEDSAEDDGETEAKKPESPKHVQQTVDVLRRTKHMSSSAHLPLRLVVLDLVDAALHVLADYEDDLLPMIHQNWPGVRHRVDDAERAVACRAVHVAATMARVSGTFVRRRIVDELLPPLTRFLTAQAARSARSAAVYEHTGAFKLQLTILSTVGAIFADIQPSKVAVEAANTACALYLAAEQPRKLQTAARQSLERLSALNNMDTST